MRSFGVGSNKKAAKPPRPEQSHQAPSACSEAATAGDAASALPKQPQPSRSSSRGLFPRVAGMASAMIHRRGRSASPQPSSKTQTEADAHKDVAASSSSETAVPHAPVPIVAAAPQGKWLQVHSLVAEEPKQAEATVSFTAVTDCTNLGTCAKSTCAQRESDMVETEVTEDDFGGQSASVELPSPTRLLRRQPSNTNTLGALATADCAKVGSTEPRRTASLPVSDLVETDVVETDFCDYADVASQPATSKSASNVLGHDVDECDAVGPLCPVVDMQTTTRSWRQPSSDMESSMGFSRPPMGVTQMSWTPMDRWVVDEEIIDADMIIDPLERRPFESLPGVPEDADAEELDAQGGSNMGGATSSTSAPDGPPAAARVQAKQSFQIAFMAERARGMSPTSAAVQALKQVPAVQAETGEPSGPGCQIEAVKSFQDAFRQQCSRGSSPNSAAVEILRRVGLPGKQEAGHPPKSMDEWGILRSRLNELEFEWV